MRALLSFIIVVSLSGEVHGYSEEIDLGTENFHHTFLWLAILISKFVFVFTNEKYKYQLSFLINAKLVINLRSHLCHSLFTDLSGR